jgi:NAD(P)H-dependent flavin oxidoreductase YrpB (nitropropane dioxygenase family)
MRTAVCDTFGIEIPIDQAPMGRAVGPRLAAAVSNAGGFGRLRLWRADIETLRKQAIADEQALCCESTRRLTARAHSFSRTDRTD